MITGNKLTRRGLLLCSYFVLFYLVVSSSCQLNKTVFGKYLSETPYCILTLNPDYTFTSNMEVHDMRYLSSGTFRVLKDTIYLNYRNGVFDSASGPPPKSLFKRKKLYYINEINGQVSGTYYAVRAK